MRSPQDLPWVVLTTVINEKPYAFLVKSQPMFLYLYLWNSRAKRWRTSSNSTETSSPRTFAASTLKRKALLTLSVESVWRNLSNFARTHPVASPLRALKSTSNTQGKLQPATGTILKYMFATVINIAFDQWQLNASKPPGKGGSYPSSPRPSAENEENEDDMDHESETTTTSNLPQSQPASYAEVSDTSNTSTSSFAFWLS